MFEGHCSRLISKVILDLGRQGYSARSVAIRLENALGVNMEGENLNGKRFKRLTPLLDFKDILIHLVIHWPSTAEVTREASRIYTTKSSPSSHRNPASPFSPPSPKSIARYKRGGASSRIR